MPETNDERAVLRRHMSIEIRARVTAKPKLRMLSVDPIKIRTAPKIGALAPSGGTLLPYLTRIHDMQDR